MKADKFYKCKSCGEFVAPENRAKHVKVDHPDLKGYDSIDLFTEQDDTFKQRQLA